MFSSELSHLHGFSTSMNSVILLNEIDGAKSIHGDPSATMLEVLDPEQNSTFTDHYIRFRVDLS